MKTPKSKPQKPIAPATDATGEINRDRIASHAYLLWEQQGRPAGRDLEFWLQAEQHIKLGKLG